MRDKLNILFMTARYPYPVVGGDRLKPYNILSYLAKKHNVTLVSFYQGRSCPEDYLEALRNINVNVYAIPLNPLTSAFRAGIAAFKYPLEIGYYYHPEFRNTVDSLLMNNKFDLSFAFFMRTAEYVRNKSLKKILMAEDCRTLYQKRSYETTNNFKQRIIRHWEYKKLCKYEPEIVNDFDVTTLVSIEDIEAMKLQNSKAHYSLLTNGTDIHSFIPLKSDFEERNGILFAGKLDVWANVLMVNKIINEIYPQILRQVPNTKLRIVGANPPKSILALNSGLIEVIPDVPAMIPYLQNSRLFLHPHNGGSGIQNKLLEAMASGCPVVTTPTGNQGIHAKDGEEVLIGKNSTELAHNSILLLNDDIVAKKLSTNARQLIVNTHSWESVFKSLDEIILDLFKMKT